MSCYDQDCSYTYQYGSGNDCENRESCSGQRGSECDGTCQSTCLNACQTYVETVCEHKCQTGVQTNRPPTTPLSIQVPKSVKVGDDIKITWDASKDTNLSGYKLERSINNGKYTVLSTTKNISYTDKALKGWEVVRYRVRAYDSYAEYSAYATSNYVSVLSNESPTISGSDGTIGNFTGPFNRSYYVDDKDLTQTLNITIKLNGAIISTVRNAERQHSYSVTIDRNRFERLPFKQRNTVEIHVTDGQGGEAFRRWYFYRTNSAPVVTVTKGNLGTLGHETNEGPNIQFKATDKEKDEMTAIIYLDGKVIASLGKIEDGKLIDYKIDTIRYRKLFNGEHTIKIEVKDANGAFGYGYVKFTKKVTKAFYHLKAETDAIVKTVVIGRPAMSLSKGAKMTITVCNNPFDDNPIYEVVPPEVYDKYYNIKNDVSKKFGLEIRYTWDRGTATSDSYIYGMVGRFE